MHNMTTTGQAFETLQRTTCVDTHPRILLLSSLCFTNHRLPPCFDLPRSTLLWNSSCRSLFKLGRGMTEGNGRSDGNL